jgi:hypothetical protein
MQGVRDLVPVLEEANKHTDTTFVGKALLCDGVKFQVILSKPAL